MIIRGRGSTRRSAPGWRVLGKGTSSMVVDALLVSSVCAGLGYVFGARRGRRYEGFLLGLVFGALGLLGLFLLKPKPLTPFKPSAEPVVTEHGPVDTVPFQWLADPLGRHQLRWWDGKRWSDEVVDDDVRSVDALGVDPPPPEHR